MGDRDAPLRRPYILVLSARPLAFADHHFWSDKYQRSTLYSYLVWRFCVLAVAIGLFDPFPCQLYILTFRVPETRF